MCTKLSVLNDTAKAEHMQSYNMHQRDKLMDKILHIIFTGINQQLVDFISTGVDVNVQDKSGRTPLIHAAIDNRVDMMATLIENGANVDTQDKVGWCALHYAAQESSYDSCKLLLENNATVDVQDVHGNTPLSNAVFNSRGYGEVIELLRSSGADINLKNKHGVSPLELANTIANFDVARFIR